MLSFCAAACLAAVAPVAQVEADLYGIGDPTDEEQLMLEYINRARANAAAEAERLRTTTDPDILWAYSYCGVDLVEMTNQFAHLQQTVQPLAFNSNLIASARLHSLDMLLNDMQSHSSSTNPPFPNDPGDGPLDRMVHQGYDPYYYGENVYAHAVSLGYCHAAFNVDWRTNCPSAPYGMLVPPGHRENIHSHVFSEIGIGILFGTNTHVGPILVTEDFGQPYVERPLLTGVAYYDLNGNGFYDVGEGLGGVAVTAPGAMNQAVTTDSGGFTIEAPNDGSYAVTFSATNLPPAVSNVSVVSYRNAKCDYIPVYAPPALTGDSRPRIGFTNEYDLTPLGGATAHMVRASVCSGAPWQEGAENGSGAVSIVSSPNYQVIQTNVVYSGSYSFHLAHPAPPTDQYITLPRTLYLQSNAVLQFASQLRTATSVQVARVEMSFDSGSTWTQLYEQAGSGAPGELAFSQRQISLDAWAGESAQVRFCYDVPNTGSNSFFFGTNALYGWLIDAITITNSLQVTNVADTVLGTEGAFDLVPGATDPIMLQVCGRYGRRSFPWTSPFLLHPSQTTSGGTPLWWFSEHLLTTNAVYPTWDLLDAADTDSDGMTCAEEYLAGTAPTNEFSRLNIASLADSIMAFQSVSGKSYRAEWRTNLLEGAWSPGNALTATGDVSLIAVPAAGNAAFYRVRLE